ncbi:MarR family winged helix-turn-helix transcriptional regulator [Agathobaculum sp. Marseille-P7918]|uniref:MarR family winged helix-turn-helix transcriptional regulator n=1 Tax=Agathobaculum sp. Marseille-P7918 TaxID=2479843 RepID=UPI000F64069A|nr:MarR family transcriptional regulator [Agathobaculum sp. Marseille-P7918]
MCDKRIGTELGMLGNLLKRQMICTTGKGEMENITGMQSMILWFLMQTTEPRFQRDVETQFRIRRSTATGILNLMEEHGLLLREPVEQDRRLKRLVLTDRAKALYERIQQAMVQTEALMEEGIDPEDLAVWFRVCDKIRANLENYQRKASEGQG